jgi:formylglycine-generating enzyme required for sulfatase activity
MVNAAERTLRASRVVALGAAALVVPACNAVFGLHEPTLAPDAGGALADAGGPGARDAAGEGAVMGNGCRGSAPPASVNIDGKFCIDGTNVTNSQYAAFLAAASPATLAQPEVCNWNDSFYADASGPPQGEFSDEPVVNVDFCDAWAYCAWAGKRLCGRVDRQPAGYNDLTSGEAYYACSGGAMQLPYAYGTTYNASACNTGPSFVTAPVATPATCVSAVYANLYDLSGNYAFWQDMCNGSTGSTDTCRETEPSDTNFGMPDAYRCDGDNGDPRLHTFEGLTIRCCSDVASR